jgi:hypothetical protein
LLTTSYYRQHIHLSQINRNNYLFERLEILVQRVEHIE